MNDILIGTTIGGYHILEEIGRGGMATVYRAHQISMNRDVAIKALPPQFVTEDVSLERFKQEASIVARLEHRAIVPVHDYGEYQGLPYIVMRYMDGGSVDDLLASGPVEPDRTLAILEQIAPALDYAHRAGVLHRDLKPSNILLDTNGDAYVTDFGIARILGSNSKPLTTSGVVGTPSYMSPEQAQGHELDGRSDIYALGVVLFEMLTGVRPYEGETPYSVAVKHVTAAIPSACKLNLELPPSIDPVLIKALAKKRHTRYATAKALAEALKTALEQPDKVMDTEPSLHEALKLSAAQHQMNVPAIAPPQPSTADDPNRLSPNIQVMRPYVPTSTPPYPATPRPVSHTGSQSAPHHTARLPYTARRNWMTGMMIALLISGLVLALVILSAYYLLDTDNDQPNPITPSLESYHYTAVFKLTSTREARPTAPPTNTPRGSTAPDDPANGETGDESSSEGASGIDSVPSAVPPVMTPPALSTDASVPPQGTRDTGASGTSPF
ncbi:MAG: protein kinase [Chloroflexi bacterium]|nr:protein kinase [Chloroflexota bacterium]